MDIGWHRKGLCDDVLLKTTTQFIPSRKWRIKAKIWFVFSWNRIQRRFSFFLSLSACTRTKGEIKKFNWPIFDAAEYVELRKEKDELNEAYVEQQQKYEELMKKGYTANAQFMDMVDQSGFPTYNFM